MARIEFRCRRRFAGGFELRAEFESDSLVTALWGPSGSGKTTILGLVAGLFEPDEGRIALGGEPNTSPPAVSVILVDTARRLRLPPERRGVGYVFQDHLLFPHLTVAENLRFGDRGRGAARTDEFTRVVELLQLGPLLDRPPRNLSGGESQRVALGRALLSHPRVLLMDEPLASLDEALKRRVLDDLERIVAELRIPLVYVSHVEAEVRRLAGTIVRMERGRVVAVEANGTESK
jgi:molybdate transport system ATP-binding protein